ncbi:SDR family NAD(P)-dependent oxidoreductase [bacterium]|nr:SDR family NAD(P)-dependent oxidoreductase [bacterium]MBU1152399.1 SDR family NAD(P)-dependent oxidoreductase [bacterium]
MKEKVLVTGGAGFIGSYLVDELVKKSYQVIIYDNLDPQVHPQGKKPVYLNKEAKFVKGDIRDRKKLYEVVKDIDYIFHEAAVVGVGQSMYEVSKYVSVNTYGTSVLLDILANEKHKVRKLLVASSMSIYGEGAYECSHCGKTYPKLRSEDQLKNYDWELNCCNCHQDLIPLPTSEEKPLQATSIYAITKKDQEEMCLNIGWTYGIPTVALRYFNVYGSRQALSNPYTGVAAIFSSRLLNKKSPIIFEDGLQGRDFIHVQDIVRANILALEDEKANFEVFNVGTGKKITILEIAKILAQELKLNIEPEVTSRYRKGDIRYCFADIAKIKERLNFKPQISFEEGTGELISWVKDQTAQDLVEKAKKELEDKGLVK